ncbi:hypothetical protein Pmani_036017 [Petrolisthes manimaculis]|uniref:Tyrosine-protein kinase n=1 Tax=Petrolisthes manimaculis TaxID=1843537 RepID=A0AAE1NKK9_9EUCA|nr:hypothetical protein Pmani_036017 [Petrolisthes manimaculis]
MGSNFSFNKKSAKKNSNNATSPEPRINTQQQQQQQRQSYNNSDHYNNPKEGGGGYDETTGRGEGGSGGGYYDATTTHHHERQEQEEQEEQEQDNETEYGYVTAMHDFEGLTESMLSFRKGQIMEVIDKSDDNWWLARHPKTTHQAYIPVTFIAAYSSLESQDWFFGDIPRIQAEQLLLSDLNECGAFLVRYHHSGTSYALSSRTVISETENTPKIKHFHISISAQGMFYLGGDRGFHTLNDLIDFLSVPLASDVSIYLQTPCRRPLPSTGTALPPPEDIFEVDRDAIVLGEKIGKGSFGDVHIGTLKDVKVAIKTLRNGTMSKEQFLEEAHIMKNLSHPNIVILEAVCTLREPFLIVIEFMPDGNLLDYLRSDDHGPLEVPHHVYIVAQVAAGMAYLEERRLMHRDLAARNVLMGPSLQCKVADFGLARICADEYYVVKEGAKFPVRWTAPEAITHQKFTIKSDVWSFGILMFEVVSAGAIPYPGMDNMDVMQFVTSGQRIGQPSECDLPLYELMLRCWEELPHVRPTFVFLQDFLHNYESQVGSSYYA